MPTRSDLLDRINIASPCSAVWDEMFGNEQVRFCEHCSLHVHDLSKITRKDVAKLVSASKGKLCVRYYRRPDGTVQTAARARPLTQIKRRLSRIAAGAFTATLSLASNTAAQSARPAERDPVVAISPSAIRDAAPAIFSGGQRASVLGTIIDPAQGVVAGARVTLVNEATGQEQKTDSHDDGTYQIQEVEAGKYKLTIESPGFMVFQNENLVLQEGREERIDATLDVEAIGGAIVMMPETPLINAIWKDGQDDEKNVALDEVRELLAAGVDVNALDRIIDSTALGEAVAVGNLEIVQALLGAGADANMRNRTGRTALMKIDEDGSVEIVRALIDAGARVNLKDEDGDSALLAAAALEKADILQTLLDAGAKVNTRNKEGKTALMIAAEEGRVANVKALLAAGADVSRKTNDGETALKYARERGSDEVIASLMAYGAY